MAETNSPADGLRRRMQEARNRLDRDVGGLVRDARGAVDWRQYVKRYPWLAAGAAAALGFLLVPKRPKVVHVDAETLAELTRTKDLALGLEGATGKPDTTLAGGLAATILAIVGRECAGWFGKQVVSFLDAEIGRRYKESPRFPESESE